MDGSIVVYTSFQCQETLHTHVKSQQYRDKNILFGRSYHKNVVLNEVDVFVEASNTTASLVVEVTVEESSF